MINLTLVSIMNQQQQEIDRLNKQILNQLEVTDSLLDTLRNFTKSDIYAAQNELELLRTIRRSQGEAITKLRMERDQARQTLTMACGRVKELSHSLAEACTERDAASKRANAWREDYNQSEQARVVAQEKLKHSEAALVHVRVERNELYKERDVAREGLAQARVEIQKLNERVGLDQDRQKLYREMDMLRNQLAVSQAVNHIVARREVNNPRLEMILEESYRNEFKRNIDNQKAVDGANCPSS